MSHLHIDGACVTVCGGVGVRYQARARWYGYRRYRLLGKATKSKRVAMRRLADAMLDTEYKRGDVLLCAEYYDPEPIVEMVRR